MRVEPRTVPRSELSLTSRQPVSRSGELAREWLVRFAEICQREITPALAAIWDEALRDVDADLLDRACRQLMGKWATNFLPTPGAIRALIDQSDEKGFDLEAEREWQKLLGWIRTNFYPDTGIRRGAPKLSAAVEFAAKAAGGYARIEGCSTDDLVWCRKEFLNSYKTIHETEKVEHLLSGREAKRILAEVSSKTVRLPAVVKSSAAIDIPEPAGKPDSGEVRSFLHSLILEKPRDEEPSREDLERRWIEQKRRAKEFLERGQNPGAASPGATV
jgi:hypothetical protein